ASTTLVPVAVEELLRWVTPAHAVRPRYVYRETEIGGKTIKRGEVVYPPLAAANWDPGVFPDPHRIDFTRGPEAMRSVLAFGGGIHNCVGAPVARLEAELYLATLARRFPNLDLEHGYRPQYRPNYCWR